MGSRFIYSSDGKILAVGSLDSFIYVYNIGKNGSYRQRAICSGHTGGVRYFLYISVDFLEVSFGVDIALTVPACLIL